VQSSTTKQVAVSNLTAGLSGTASININGTVGATTATTGAFTSGTFSTTLGVTGASTLAAVNASGLFTNTYNSISDFKLIVQNTGSNDGVSGGLILGAKNTAGTQSNVSFGVESVNGANASATIRTAGSGTGFGSIRFTIDGAGAVTIPGTLGVTGLITATTAGISVPTSAAGTVHSGTYTPTRSASVNVDSANFTTAFYSRTGNVVNVGGSLDINTTSATVTSFEINLPVASNLASGDLAGTMFVVAARNAGFIGQVAANDTAGFVYTATTSDDQTIYYNFSYIVK
jgi:hypothetical protein